MVWKDVAMAYLRFPRGIDNHEKAHSWQDFELRTSQVEKRTPRNTSIVLVDGIL
jgi:hypothetical protein